MNIDKFVLEQVFNRLEHDADVYYWRECVEPGEGYIVLFIDGDNVMSHHTYHHPENFL